MPSNYVEIRVKSAGIVLHCIALFCRTRSVSVACRLILSSIYPCGISASRVKTADERPRGSPGREASRESCESCERFQESRES